MHCMVTGLHFIQLTLGVHLVGKFIVILEATFVSHTIRVLHLTKLVD